MYTVARFRQDGAKVKAYSEYNGHVLWWNSFSSTKVGVNHHFSLLVSPKLKWPMEQYQILLHLKIHAIKNVLTRFLYDIQEIRHVFPR